MDQPAQCASKPFLSREAAGLLLGFVGVVVFGGTLPATRVALGLFSPWFITYGRAAVASAAAALVLLALRRPFPRQDATSLLLAGALLVFGFPILSSIALQTVPAAHGGVVLGILPLATSIFAALLGGERPSPLFWICGVVGAALVIGFALYDSELSFSSGDSFLLLAALAASLGYVVSGKVARTMPGWEVICWALILTSPASAVGAILTFDSGYLQASPEQAFAFFYLALGSMFLGFFAWNVGLAMGGIARVSQVQLLQTFVTLALAALFLGERITLETLVFAGAVVLVVALGRRARISR
ncbi:DMT family transporter [Pseudaminobacter sp. 19-2017]|uniref:DMT family transporter n=1 Tax=Pseudaminobacter soli (ex Zhang et al. 2022) TaxID=2831468 RepID=A0A942DX04_9HYPH|nr:EamA family transporter [Pseudaminobacter soli]MBS3649169.1 DMT family transporter [Pseudaminobacter soli]